MAFITTGRHRPQNEPPGTGHIPPELREAFASIDPVTEAKIVNQLHRVNGEIQFGSRTIDPSAGPAQFAEALLKKKLEHARVLVNAERHQAEQRAADARNFKCLVCGKVEPPFGPGLGVQHRPLVDGTPAKTCRACHALLDRELLEQYGSQNVNGTTRQQLARTYLANRR